MKTHEEIQASRVEPINFGYRMPSGINAGYTMRELFNARISVDPDNCWHWVGQKDARGYGIFGHKGRKLLAHRVSFEMASGVVPDGVVMHKCDNPSCVNPDHLKLGTLRENIQDCVLKGRNANKGGLNGSKAKLSDEDVNAIRLRRDEGESYKELAKEFGVSMSWLSILTRGIKRGDTSDATMSPDDYVNLAMRTSTDLGYEGNLIHATLLLCSEAGEVASEVKRTVAYGKKLDVHNVKEELGDILWGVALMCQTLSIPMVDVMRANIAKLAARYPDGKFDANHAINRDKEAEAQAMSGA